jgi:hypothetical protein
MIDTDKSDSGSDNGGNSAGDTKSIPIVTPSGQKATPSTSTTRTPIVTPQG